MIFLNENEEEIDRIVGFLPADKFLEEMKRIQSGKNTFLSLRTILNNNPDNSEAVSIIADKYSDRNEPDAALAHWLHLKDLNDENFNHQAEYKITEMEGMRDFNPDKILTFIDNNPDSPYYYDALLAGMRILAKTGGAEDEARLYLEYVKYLENTGELKYSSLNGYAWRMTELGLNLEVALEKAKQAVDMAKSEGPEDQVQVMDTLAEVYWKLGDIENAVKVIDEAIVLQPEDEYLVKQKEKFSS